MMKPLANSASGPLGTTAIARSQIEPLELISLLRSRKYGLIDVRSEKEFSEGHLPHFVNHPILRNDERHNVGIAYKQEGRDFAIQVGSDLVSPHREQLLADWTHQVLTSASQIGIICCWRGGLRSQIATEWLTARGIQVKQVRGGYKAVRNFLLNLLNQNHRFLVLSGPTGSGKTQLIRNTLFPKIDLEAIAYHRGSCFGGHWFGSQPSQASFENELAVGLAEPTEMLIEDESSRIGTIHLPLSLKSQMRQAPLVYVDEPLENRIARIFEEYVKAPLTQMSPAQLAEGLRRRLLHLSRRLGGALYQSLDEQLTSAFRSGVALADHSGWIQCLLERHYDPTYQWAFSQQNRPILFRGSNLEVAQWFQNQWHETKAETHV